MSGSRGNSPYSTPNCLSKQRTASGLRPDLRATAADDFRRRTAGLHQPPRAVNDRVALFGSDLAELRPPPHLFGIQGDKAIDRTLQKSHPLAPAHDKAAADQTEPAPAGHSLRRDIEFLGQLVNRDDPLAGRVRRHVRGIGEVLDEQQQIVLGIEAVEFYLLVGFPANVRNPVADVFVGINTVGNDLGQELLGGVHLLDLLLRKASALAGPAIPGGREYDTRCASLRSFRRRLAR